MCGNVGQYVYESDYSLSEGHSLSEGLSSSNSLEDTPPISGGFVDHVSLSSRDDCASSESAYPVSPSTEKDTLSVAQSAHAPDSSPAGRSGVLNPLFSSVVTSSYSTEEQDYSVSLNVYDSIRYNEFERLNPPNRSACSPPFPNPHLAHRRDDHPFSNHAGVSTLNLDASDEDEGQRAHEKEEGDICNRHVSSLRILRHHSNRFRASDSTDEEDEDDDDESNLLLDYDYRAYNSGGSNGTGRKRLSSTHDTTRDSDTIGSEVSSAGFALYQEDHDAPSAPVVPYLSASMLSGLEHSLESSSLYNPYFVSPDDARRLFMSESSDNSSLSISLDLVRPLDNVFSRPDMKTSTATNEISNDNAAEPDTEWERVHPLSGSSKEDIAALLERDQARHGTRCVGKGVTRRKRSGTYPKSVVHPGLLQSNRQGSHRDSDLKDRCWPNSSNARDSRELPLGSEQIDPPLAADSNVFATRNDSVPVFLEEDGTHPRVAIVAGQFRPIPIEKLHTSRCRASRYCVYHPSDPYAFEIRFERYLASSYPQEEEDNSKQFCRRRSSTAGTGRRRRGSLCGRSRRYTNSSCGDDINHEPASALSVLAARLSDLQVNPFSRCSAPSEISSAGKEGNCAQCESDNEEILQRYFHASNSAGSSLSPAKALATFGFVPDPLRVELNCLLACRRTSIKSGERDLLASSLISSDSCQDS